MASLETTQSKIIYVGDGGTTVFPYPFLFYSDSDLKVYLSDTLTSDAPVLLTITTHYTIGAGEAGDPDGGNVTMLIAPISTEELIIDREVDETQESEYTNYNRFPAGTVEKNLNRLTMMIQKHSEEISRMLIQDIDSTNQIEIPSPLDGRALKWDALGNLINSDFDPDDQQQSIEDAQAAQVAAELAATESEGHATDSENSATASAASAALIGTNDVEWRSNVTTEVVIANGSKFAGVDSGTQFEFTSARTFDIEGTIGTLGALDTGETETNSTWYYLIGLGDTTNTVSPHVIGVSAASYASFTTGNLIGNYAAYNDYKRIGAIRNSSSGDFFMGEYYDGVFYHDDIENSVIVSNASFVDADFTDSIPPVSRRINLIVSRTSAGDVLIRMKGAINGGGVPTLEVNPGSGESASLEYLVDTSGILEVQSPSGNAYLQTTSYVDKLVKEGQ